MTGTLQGVPTPDGPRPSTAPRRRLVELARRWGAAATPAPGTAFPMDEVVTGVTLSSGSVRPGDLYAALPGARTHGAQFCAEAAAAGARAVLTDPAGAGRAGAAGLPALVVPDPREVLGDLAADVYGFPAADLLLLGVTGTNGKTTTSYLLDGALRATGRRTGLVGTVETRICGTRVPSERTTPEAPDLQALLAVMRERQVEVCSLEVSSHALALHRVDGLVVDVAGFTNLGHDHLDFHRSVEEYFAVKASLFTPEHSRRGVVCVDGEWGARLAEQATVPVVRVRTDPAADSEPGSAADWQVRQVCTAGGAATTFRLDGRDGRRLRLTSPLPGSFNVANTALAAVMLLEAGLTPQEVTAGLAAVEGVPGRMERVQVRDGQPLAVVDYAHTPDAVRAALQALRPATAGTLVVVLGAGGDRDRGKRAPMGAAAAEAADVVVVTDDNPRQEDPAAIRAAVLAGAREQARRSGRLVLEVPERAEAIAVAAGYATGPADTLLVAGKGHELGQEVAGRVHPFDDRQVLRSVLQRGRESVGRGNR